MTLEQVLNKLSDFAKTHDYDADFDEFDSLCNEVMSDNQTYFQWSMDDCFDTAEAFDTVMECIKKSENKGKQIKESITTYLFDDDRLFLFVEYK